MRFESYFHDKFGKFEIRAGSRTTSGRRNKWIWFNTACSAGRLPTGPIQGSVVTWDCSPALNGRFLTAQMWDHKKIQVAEIEVFT